jgi:hypothetical protein
MLVYGQRHAPASLPPERDTVPIAQEDGSGLVRKFWPPDPRALQPAASRYSDRGIPGRDSAESVAIRDLSIASVRKQDNVLESVFVCYQMEVSGGTYWVGPTEGIVLNYSTANTNLLPAYVHGLSGFALVRLKKKSHKFTVTHVEIPMKTHSKSKSRVCIMRKWYTARDGSAVPPPTKNDLHASLNSPV